MISPLECRLRAAECERMATQAHNAPVRNILADMARTWTRLALEAEQTLRLKQGPSRVSETSSSRSWQVRYVPCRDFSPESERGKSRNDSDKQHPTFPDVRELRPTSHGSEERCSRFY